MGHVLAGIFSPVRLQPLHANAAGTVHAQAAAGRQGDPCYELGAQGWCYMGPRRDPAGLSLPWPGRSHVHSAVHSNTGV